MMTATEILLNEYNNLWREKLIHTEAIRKFHTYFTYIAALASLALLLRGISVENVFVGLEEEDARAFSVNASNALNAFCIVLPMMMLLLSLFPLNDLFHIEALGRQIARIEREINTTANSLLL